MVRSYFYEDTINKFYIKEFDGDCIDYVIFDSEEEMNAYKDKVRKIEEEARQKYLAYMSSLEY